MLKSNVIFKVEEPRVCSTHLFGLQKLVESQNYSIVLRLANNFFSFFEILI